ncbi:MAG: DNA-directed RNA polymerase subunit beta', partial [Candidatus Kerfeldbacteria bacterium]|nr:DNA-directed RNA polymerase subunit beta' [Candidatus Kerfeldbacteria bacterium]
RTANAGYLTRRLVDVAQEVVTYEEDCGDTTGTVVTKQESEDMSTTLADRVWGRVVLEDVVHPKTDKVIVKSGGIVDRSHLADVVKCGLLELRIRSVLTCKAERGICRACYGNDLGRNKPVEEGVAVGIIAAQSIGEPGTQLTMRTFHTGGVVGTDITQGLPRVEELFEARPVKKPAVIAEHDGVVHLVTQDRQRIIRLTYTENQKEVIRLVGKGAPEVKDGDHVHEGQVLFTPKRGEPKVASGNGVVKVSEKQMTLLKEVEMTEEYPAPESYFLLVKNGDLVVAGQQLTEGSLDLHQLYRLKGRDAVQRYILKEIQYIYSSQGQKLNDKHIEIIIRQLFSRFYITEPGETELIAGNIVSRTQFMKANREAKEEGKKPAKAENLLMGITKASLSTDSFLSAASFQETARVLIDAAVSGKIDRLDGLKENVIIGKLIPVGTGFYTRREEMEALDAQIQAEREQQREQEEEAMLGPISTVMKEPGKLTDDEPVAPPVSIA